MLLLPMLLLPRLLLPRLLPIDWLDWLCAHGYTFGFVPMLMFRGTLMGILGLNDFNSNFWGLIVVGTAIFCSYLGSSFSSVLSSSLWLVDPSEAAVFKSGVDDF